MSESDQIALQVDGLEVSYGPVNAVRGIDLTVPKGSVVALLGANGAGKTSSLQAIGGQCRSRGRVRLGGRDISDWKPHKVAAAGFSQVPQGRRLFPQLTTEENLLVGAWRRGRRERRQSVAEAFERFPRLAERRDARAGSLSGGEQQMVAIARALMRSPSVLAMDEPSLGLAPIVVHEVFERIEEIRHLGVSVLLVEQNAVQALAHSDYAYVLNHGAVVHHGPSEKIAEEVDVIDAYLR